ncbi:sorting nexin-25 [Striga asiatica]|uniref:Sorting nexin-25 n=1 Tax=Striga asiatica TaxID=4170 RepID=A0A5A7P158_STRAF|nr:sorting nexin-25 [Striga asiatica]
MSKSAVTFMQSQLQTEVSVEIIQYTTTSNFPSEYREESQNITNMPLMPSKQLRRFVYQPTAKIYSLCFTRLPFASPPSITPSIPCLPTIECSLILATYSNNSVSTCGQLSFRYSKPSVCITAVQNSFHRLGKK